MQRIPLYCDLQALLDFFALRPSPEGELDDMAWAQIWMDFYSLLSRQATLHLNMPTEQLLELGKTNPYIKKLFKSSSTGGSSLRCLPELFADLQNLARQAPCQSYFLLAQTEETCNQLEQQHGLFFLTPSQLRTKGPFLFNWSLYNITKDQRALKRLEDWRQLERFRHPCNSMVVMDNYILKDPDEIAENLLPLLDALLPMQLQEAHFSLMVVTVETQDDPRERKKLLEDMLQRLRPYPFSVCLLLVGSYDNHDRNIFTNYLWLHSGHSFTYFRQGRVSKKTNLMLFPLSYQQKDFQSYYLQAPQDPEVKSSVWEAVQQKLKDVRYLLSKYDRGQDGYELLGPADSPLLGQP